MIVVLILAGLFIAVISFELGRLLSAPHRSEALDISDGVWFTYTRTEWPPQDGKPEPGPLESIVPYGRGKT